MLTSTRTCSSLWPRATLGSASGTPAAGVGSEIARLRGAPHQAVVNPATGRACPLHTVRLLAGDYAVTSPATSKNVLTVGATQVCRATLAACNFPLSGVAKAALQLHCQSSLLLCPPGCRPGGTPAHRPATKLCLTQPSRRAARSPHSGKPPAGACYPLCAMQPMKQTHTALSLQGASCCLWPKR